MSTLITAYIKSSFHPRQISCRMKLILYLLLLKFQYGFPSNTLNGKWNQFHWFFFWVDKICSVATEGVNRTERTLFKKLHSGAAFLAGVKLGSIFKDRTPFVSSGNLAATSSLNVLGKSVSTAFSFAYGDAHLSQQLYDPVK